MSTSSRTVSRKRNSVGALNKSPKVNWIEANGGLPNFIERIALHLVAKGMSDSHAIASAVSTVKKWCATGDVTQWAGIQVINAGSRAEACKAVAEWEALKARAGKH